VSELAQRRIQPPAEGATALKGEALAELQGQLGDGWEIIEDHHLEKAYSFDDFQGALEFTNRVGELAEAANHHPEICLTWGRATVTIWTHSVGGLSEADFVFAAKADELV
jgi:4a-hydroxytetrahydrobiopterin dehydratase